MEKIEQENSQEVQQKNFLDGKTQTEATVSTQPEELETEEPTEPEVVQLVLPQEALDRVKEFERQYRETVERENV